MPAGHSREGPEGGRGLSAPGARWNMRRGQLAVLERGRCVDQDHITLNSAKKNATKN